MEVVTFPRKSFIKGMADSRKPPLPTLELLNASNFILIGNTSLYEAQRLG
jgi:hypothetical protein